MDRVLLDGPEHVNLALSTYLPYRAAGCSIGIKHCDPLGHTLQKP